MLQARARAVESLPANGAESHQRGYAQALLDSVEHVDRLAMEQDARPVVVAAMERLGLVLARET